MNCIKCGHEIETGSAFCGNCGQPVAPAAVPAAPAQPALPLAAPTDVPAPVPDPTVPQTANPAIPPVSPAPGQTYSIPSEMAKPGGGKAIASFVLGVLGLIFWILPLLGLIVGVIALVFGTQSVRSRHRKLSIAGIVLATVALLLSLMALTYNLQNMDTQQAALRPQPTAVFRLF